MARIFPKFIALLFGLTVWLSHAQITPDQNTLQYFNSEPHKKLITMMGLAYEQNLHDRKDICPTGYRWDPISFAILQPLSFQSALEYPDAGVWTYRFKFFGCGDPVVYNVIFQGQGGKQPRPAALPPGMTKVDLRLFSDLMKGLGVAGGIAGVQADCKSIKILDTQVTAQPFRQELDGKVNEGVWEEQWVARACTKEFTTDFCLTPQISGGTNWLLGKCRRSHQ